MLRIFIIAGEASGDKLGAGLMEGLKTLTENKVVFSGIGGAMMQSAGLHSLFPMSDLSVMGLFEVLPSIPRIMKRISETTQAAMRFCPDVFITIDSPDFCLRVGRRLKKNHPDLPMIHYVAPSVWAWRPKRAAKMARSVDHVLALLPFEPPYMEAAGLTCDFVGHPAASEPIPMSSDIQIVLSDLGLTQDQEIIAILPGSRRSEIKRLLPIFLAAARHIHAQNPGVRFILPAAQAVLKDIQTHTQNIDIPLCILDPTPFDAATAEHRKRCVYAASRAAMAASGTIALDLAKQSCPMVVTYKVSWLSEQIAKRLWLSDRINLVNIVTDTYEIPELLFEKCNAKTIAEAVLTLVHDHEAHARQVALCKEAVRLLGEHAKAPGLRAAHSVLKAIGKISLV